MSRFIQLHLTHWHYVDQLDPQSFTVVIFIFFTEVTFFSLIPNADNTEVQTGKFRVISWCAMESPCILPGRRSPQISFCNALTLYPILLQGLWYPPSKSWISAADLPTLQLLCPERL